VRYPLIIKCLFIIFCQFTASLSLAFEAPPKVNISAEPDWVQLSQITEQPLADMRRPNHYYLVEEQANAGDIKQAFYRYAYSPTDSSGLNDYSDVSIYFNPAYETLTIHKVSVIRNGQTIYQLRQEDIQLLNAEDDKDSNIYSGEYQALIQLKNVQIGDLIDYSYSIIGINPVFDGHFDYSNWLAWGIDVDEVHILVTAPSDNHIRFNVYGMDNSIVDVSTHHNQQYFQIRLTDIPALPDEDKVPGWQYTAPYVEFSDYQSWHDVARWADKLFKLDSLNSTAYSAYISELKQLPVEQALNNAINFVQNDVRYLGLELGVNSHKPHHPAEVFENRFGDCKDKSFLLVDLLKAIGVEANVALVSTRRKRALDQRLPGHYAFNHAITKIKWRDQDYWIDPTVTHQGSKIENKHQFNYERALVVSADSKALIDATPIQNIQTRVDVIETIIAPDYFSPVYWRVKTTFSGEEAEYMRYKLATSGIQKLEKQYINYYAKTYPKIKPIQKLKAIDNLEANTIVFEERYLVPGYWSLTEDKSAEFKLTANYVSQYLTQPETIIRQHPLSIGEPVHSSHKVTIQFPEDIDFSQSSSENVINNEYLLFKSKIEYDRRRLTFINELNIKQSFVPAADVADYLSVAKTIDNQMMYTNSITNVTQEYAIEEMKTLLSALNQKQLAD